jgi:hypothetical protein
MKDADVKSGPIAGIAGILALLAAALSLLGPRDTELAARVQQYFDAADAQTPAERHRQVDEQIQTLEGFQGDSGFARLPKGKRDAVADRLGELRAYQAYAAEVESIPAASSAASEEKLRDLQEQLGRLKVPVAYQKEWSETDAGRRRQTLEADAQALRRAVDELTAAYRKAADEAEALRRNSEAPGLPARARKILMEADRLPTPDAASLPIPGTTGVPFATAFGFASVKAEYQRWQQAREQVKGLARLGT